jgi:hypothetical protein
MILALTADTSRLSVFYLYLYDALAHSLTLHSCQHDATPTICTFNLTVLDTLRGLYKAREHKFFDLDHFDLQEYEHYEQVL